jgi:hypothetical protein
MKYIVALFVTLFLTLIPAQSQAAPKHPNPAWRQVTTCRYDLVELPGPDEIRMVCKTKLVHKKDYHNYYHGIR